MELECSCGCDTLVEPHTRQLQVVLDRLGFVVANTKACTERFEVVAMIDEITEEEVQRLLMNIKGVNFTYAIFDEVTKYRVHCIIKL